MSSFQVMQAIVIGLVAGVAGGMFGIGGGLIMVPALALWMGMEQKLSTGTSLGAQVLPVALLGAWKFHSDGNLDLKAAALLAGGLLVGNLVGAYIQSPIEPGLMKKIYGGFLLLVACRYLFFK